MPTQTPRELYQGPPSDGKPDERFPYFKQNDPVIVEIKRLEAALTAAQASLDETRNALFAVNSDNESLMRRLSCAEASLEEAKKDAARVLYVSRLMDGIGDHDFHDDAAVYASAFGREEANNDDYLAAVRDAIDAARGKER